MPTRRPAEDDDRHALQDQQPAESDDERRHLQPGHERSLEGADRAQASNVTMIAAHHGQFAPLGCTSSATTTLPSAHDQADGQVDLSQEQGEDLSDRQQHVHGALLEEVDQVLRRQELRVHDLEADGDHHEAQDHRQDTAVAAADPEPRGPEVFVRRMYHHTQQPLPWLHWLKMAGGRRPQAQTHPSAVRRVRPRGTIVPTSRHSWLRPMRLSSCGLRSATPSSTPSAIAKLSTVSYFEHHPRQTREKETRGGFMVSERKYVPLFLVINTVAAL